VQPIPFTACNVKCYRCETVAMMAVIVSTLAPMTRQDMRVKGTRREGLRSASSRCAFYDCASFDYRGDLIMMRSVISLDHH
jgi:hypothetical protein